MALDIWTPIAASGLSAGPDWQHLPMDFTGPNRHYHTAAHVMDMLGFILWSRLEYDEACVARQVAWYHDLVYDPQYNDNEEQSARRAITDGMPQRVADLILATKDHTQPNDDPLWPVIHDADLFILAAPERRYRQYAADIRREYAHVPDDAYRKGRMAVLAKLMDQPRLFLDPDVYAVFGRAAHLNIGTEYERLESGLSLHD